MRAQSSSPKLPVRRWLWSTRPSEEIMRIASWSRDISIENTATGMPGADRGVLRDVERERGLAHRGAPRDDDQVAGLQSGRHGVEVVVAGADAGELALALLQQVEPVDRGAEDVVQRHEPRAGATPLLGDLEDAPLGLVHEVGGGAPLALVGARRDLAAHPDQLPQQRALADDVGVGADVGGGGRVPREPCRGRRARPSRRPAPSRPGTRRASPHRSARCGRTSSAMPVKICWWSRR